MKMRKIKKLGIELSAFGLGCMRFPMIKDKDGNNVVDEKICTEIVRYAIDNGVNYIDTAYVYSEGQSEKYVGIALENGYRQRVFLATKLPVWNCHSKKDMYDIFDKQCENLRTEYIDFYLVHALNLKKWHEMKELGICDFLDDLKAKGKIKYACFSFHDSYEAFEEILNDYNWDMCQIQFNYMDIDNQAGLKGLKLAGEKGIPLVIMEGLLGGKLANVPEDVKELFNSYKEKRSPVEWAFRWLCNFPEVATVLSGTTSVEMTQENIDIFSRTGKGIMTQQELDIVSKARELYRARIRVDCTGCAYCMPCPAGVDIPEVFKAWNETYKYDSQDLRYNQLEKDGKGASKCISCKKCTKVCPQKLDIPELLEQSKREMSK